ncbi:MAG: hypothetical protein ACREFQ_11190 [Stellaceae bacterium]
MRRAALWLAWLCCLVLLPAVVAAVPATWTIGGYSVALLNADTPVHREMRLTIARDGAILYRMQDARIWVNPAALFMPLAPGAPYTEGKLPYRVGSDVLRLGAPSLAVEGFSGGAHCCFTLTPFILGARFHALPPIALKDSDGGRFTPARVRHGLVLSFRDFTFAYWRAPFYASSAPRVVLSYDARAGRYTADAGLMRAPLPPPKRLAEWQAAAQTAHRQALAQGSWFVPAALTRPMLDLVYAGHIAAARAFLERVWAGSSTSRADYWADLTTCELRLSPYWPTIARMNGLRADPPVGQCPRPWPKSALRPAR